MLRNTDTAAGNDRCEITIRTWHAQAIGHGGTAQQGDARAPSSLKLYDPELIACGPTGQDALPRDGFDGLDLARMRA